MSLDLYAGSLAKFYSRDFETPQARFARENGYNYDLIYPEGAPKWFSPEEAPAAILSFKKILSEKSSGKFSADWDDSVEGYYADQLLNEARAALVVVAAYAKRADLACPKHLPTDLDNDPAYLEAVDKGYYLDAMAALEAALWLPEDEDLLLIGDDPMGWQIAVSTHGALARTLSALTESIWSGNIDIEGWAFRGAAPGMGKTMRERKFRLPWQSKWIEQPEPQAENSLMWNAEYAFAIFSKALEFARMHHVPIRVDE